jgi:hypothetical protein
MVHPFPNTRNERLAAPESAAKVHSKLRKSGKLGEKLWLFGKGRSKKGREAAPPRQLEKTAAMPTQQRLEKNLPKIPESLTKEQAAKQREKDLEAAWKTETHPGGQVSYQEVTSLAVLKPDLSVHEMKLLVMIAQDYQAAQAVKVMHRQYTGEPFSASKGADTAIIKQGQRANRSDFMARHMSRHVDFWWLLIRMVVLGAHYARLGRPLTPAEISAMMLHSKDAHALGLSGTMAVKLTVLRAQEAYHAWLETQPAKVIEPANDRDPYGAVRAEERLLKRLAKPQGRNGQ